MSRDFGQALDRDRLRPALPSCVERGSVARGVGFQMSASDLAKPAACVAGMAAWEPAVWWRRRGCTAVRR